MRYPSIRSVRHTCKSCDGFWAGIGFEPKPRVSGRLRRAPVGSRAKLSVEYFTGMGPSTIRQFRQAFPRGNVCRQLHSQLCPGCDSPGSELFWHSEQLQNAAGTCVHSVMFRWIEEARECSSRFLL